MSQSSDDQHLPKDLEHLADALRDERPKLDPLALDRVKLRAMSAARQSNASRPMGFMRQRLTAVLTAGLLLLGTGGTLALAGGVGGSGSASFDQYKPPPCVHGKGAGVPNECPGEKPEPPPCVHGKGAGVANECPGEKPEPPPCVHGKGAGVANECPGEKVEKPGHGGKGEKGKGGKGGHGNKSGKGHRGKGKSKGSKGNKGSKGSHSGKHRPGHKSDQGNKRNGH